MLETIEVRPGQIVEGRYKRAFRDAKPLKVLVESAVLYNGLGMLVGTNMDVATGGQRIGCYAAGFDPRNVQVEESDEEISFDADAHYLTASSRAFGFVEEVKPEDREWARMLGGVPLSEIAVDHVLLAAVKEASD